MNSQIKEAAIKTAQQLCPNFSEAVHQKLFIHYLEQQQIRVIQEKQIIVHFDGVPITFREDLYLPDYKLVIELKATKSSVTIAQVNQTKFYLANDPECTSALLIKFHSESFPGEYDEKKYVEPVFISFQK